MTRDQLVEKFRVVIDEVGTSEFENVDVYLNTAITSLFGLMVDPKSPRHPDAKGFEKDVYTGEYLRKCKFPIEGNSATPGLLSRAQIEAQVLGRTLSRLSALSLMIGTGTSWREAQVLSSARVSRSKNLRFYNPRTCVPVVEIVNDGYRIFPDNEPFRYKGIALFLPRTVSLLQQEVDFPDELEAAIVYHACSLAGVSVRDSEFVAANSQMIQFLGL